MESKRANLVLYDDIKFNIPKQIKVSLIAAITHKFKAFISILDLSFSLKLAPQGHVLSVNFKKLKTAPGGAIHHIGHALLQLIHAFVEAWEGADMFQAKWDIMDGFWSLYCKEGEEWNFFCVLPQKPVMHITLVVTMLLQIGWIE